MRNGEGLQRLFDQISQCYQGVVSDAKQYAIDFGALTPPYQASLDTVLNAMAEQVWNETSLTQFRTNVQNSFRGFKDQAEQQIQRLRNDLEQTTTSLSAVLKALEYDEPAQSLRTQVHHLTDLQKLEDISQLKRALQTALVKLEKGLEETEKRNRMAISDLQAEISVLQNRVVVLAEQKVGERSLRAVLDDRMTGGSFLLLVARLAGLGRIKTKHGEAGVSAVMSLAQQRMATAMGPTLAIGLWDPQTIGMVMNQAGAPASALTRNTTTALSGRYDVLDETVNLQASAGVVEWRPPDDRAQFLRRLQDLLHVLRT